MITVPARFAARFTDPAARRWIDELPGLAERLCATWSLRPDGPVLHGFVAIALPVRRADGSPAMLKLTARDPETVDEPLALATWDGNGAVRLLAHDDAHGALLLERLDSNRILDDEPIDVAVPVAGELLRRLSVPAPRLSRRLSEMAERWCVELPAENIDGIVPQPLLDKAIGLCRELGPRAAGLMVNEDLHYQNILRGRREPWLAIDPKVLTGDPEFALISLLWNRFDADDTIERLATLTEIAGLDLGLARKWTFVRAIDNWLWAAHGGEFPSVDICARIAQLVG